MLNVNDPGKYTRSVRPLVPRSPEEYAEQLALYAPGTIICLTPGRGTCGSRVAQSRKRTPLAMGHMVWRQATHALEHIDEIRLTRRWARALGARERWSHRAGRRAEPTASVQAGRGPSS